MRSSRDGSSHPSRQRRCPGGRSGRHASARPRGDPEDRTAGRARPAGRRRHPPSGGRRSCPGRCRRDGPSSRAAPGGPSGARADERDSSVGPRCGTSTGAWIEWHDDHVRRSSSMTATTGAKPHPIFLAGQWVESDDPLVIANPADPDKPGGATFHASEAQYEEAVQAAVRAFEVTRTLPAYERGAILRNISAGIKARREELGRLIALEAGKPIRDSLVEVDRAVLTFRLGAEEAERMVGETIPLDLMPASKGRMGITRRFPIGPIAAISPFNFPLNLAAHKLAPAIAAGNPIVLKPPSKDPLTMLTVAEVVEAAGVPAGMVSILPMTRELGDRMVADDRFKLLTFTGSPSVGWRMKERAGKKKVVLELGGDAGAMVDANAVGRTKRWVDEAVALGGEVVLGGEPNGLFFPPTILAGVP